MNSSFIVHIRRLIFRFRSQIPNPKTVRAITLLTGTFSQFVIYFILNQNFGDAGIILLGALSVLGILVNQVEFGKFSLLVSILNDDSYTEIQKRDIVGTLIAQVLRNSLIFFVLVTPIIPTLIRSLSLAESAIFAFLVSITNALTFIIKYLLAVSLQSQYFIIFSVLHLIMPITILTATLINLNLQVVLIVNFTTIMIYNLYVSFRITKRYGIVVALSTKLTPSHTSYSNYFFVITLELGLLYQWDRLWVALVMNSSDSAKYTLLFLVYSSLNSILSIDYQNYWNKSTWSSVINFNENAIRMLKQGVLFLLLFIPSSYAAFILLRKPHDQVLVGILLFSFALLSQSIHNFTAGITSKSVSGLKFHSRILAVCIIFRVAYLIVESSSSKIDLSRMLCSWVLPFILIQVPATIFYAIRVTAND